MNQSDWAAELARKLLEVPLPRRWAHVQGVAAQARSLAPILGDDADLLEAAAWLHDIGYSPKLADTGFHPLDGARYLRDVEHADLVLCRLVANHSCAIIEADERGLANVLSSEFPVPAPMLNDALAYCDMTTTPHRSLSSRCRIGSLEIVRPLRAARRRPASVGSSARPNRSSFPASCVQASVFS